MPLDQSGQAKHHHFDPRKQTPRWPTSNRNPGRLQIGIGGRLPIGMRGRLRRNPLHRGKLVAAHLRSLRPYRPTTLADHMPSSHRRYHDWTHERILREAKSIGDDAAALVEIILRSRPHPEQGFRSCIGILRLATRYDAERLDAACARALALGTRSYSSVAAILRNAQDRKPRKPEQPSLLHENIRGPGYYH